MDKMLLPGWVLFPEVFDKRTRIAKLGIEAFRSKTLKGGYRDMEKPYRYRKKLIKSGGSNYVIIPATWKGIEKGEVIVEVFTDKIIIWPVKTPIL